MGSRDIGSREKKKPKKDIKKQGITSNIEETPKEVEVIRKGKKTKDWADEED